MFSATSWVLKKWSFNCNLNVNTLWTLIGCFRKFVCTIIREELGQNFFTGKIALFFMFSATSWVMTKWSYNFLKKLPCGTPIIVPWRLCCFKIREEIGEKLFFTGKFSSFFKSLCFQQPLGSWRNSFNFNINCQVTLWNPYKLFPDVFLFYNTRRSRRKSFLHWKVCIFLQKFMFSATSWVLKKWSFNFNIKCLITLWRTPIIFPDVCVVLKYEKK